MIDALQLLVFGLTAGAVVALSAVGFTLTCAVTRQVNLAHGNVFALTTVAVASLARLLGVTAATPLHAYTLALILAAGAWITTSRLATARLGRAWAAVAIGRRWGLLGVVGGALLVALYDRVLVDAVSAGLRVVGGLVGWPRWAAARPARRQFPGVRLVALPGHAAPTHDLTTLDWPVRLEYAVRNGRCSGQSRRYLACTLSLGPAVTPARSRASA